MAPSLPSPEKQAPSAVVAEPLSHVVDAATAVQHSKERSMDAYLATLRTRDAVSILDQRSRGDSSTETEPSRPQTETLVEQTLSTQTIACLARWSKEAQQPSPPYNTSLTGGPPGTLPLHLASASASGGNATQLAPSGGIASLSTGGVHTVSAAALQLKAKTNTAMAKNHLREVLFGDSDKSVALTERLMKRAEQYHEDEWGLASALQEDLDALASPLASTTTAASTSKTAGAAFQRGTLRLGDRARGAESLCSSTSTERQRMSTRLKAEEKLRLVILGELTTIDRILFTDMEIKHEGARTLSALYTFCLDLIRSVLPITPLLTTMAATSDHLSAVDLSVDALVITSAAPFPLPLRYLSLVMLAHTTPDLRDRHHAFLLSQLPVVAKALLAEGQQLPWWHCLLCLGRGDAAWTVDGDGMLYRGIIEYAAAASTDPNQSTTTTTTTAPLSRTSNNTIAGDGGQQKVQAWRQDVADARVSASSQTKQVEKDGLTEDDCLSRAATATGAATTAGEPTQPMDLFVFGKADVGESKSGAILCRLEQHLLLTLQRCLARQPSAVATLMPTVLAYLQHASWRVRKIGLELSALLLPLLLSTSSSVAAFAGSLSSVGKKGSAETMAESNTMEMTAFRSGDDLSLSEEERVLQRTAPSVLEEPLRLVLARLLALGLADAQPLVRWTALHRCIMVRATITLRALSELYLTSEVPATRADGAKLLALLIANYTQHKDSSWSVAAQGLCCAYVKRGLADEFIDIRRIVLQSAHLLMRQSDHHFGKLIVTMTQSSDTACRCLALRALGSLSAAVMKTEDRTPPKFQQGIFAGRPGSLTADVINALQDVIRSDAEGQVRCLALETASKLDLLSFLYPILQQEIAYEDQFGLTAQSQPPSMQKWYYVSRDVLKMAAQRSLGVATTGPLLSRSSLQTLGGTEESLLASPSLVMSQHASRIQSQRQLGPSLPAGGVTSSTGNISISSSSTQDVSSASREAVMQGLSHRVGHELMGLAEAIHVDRAVVTQEIIDAERLGLYHQRRAMYPLAKPHRPALYHRPTPAPLSRPKVAFTRS